MGENLFDEEFNIKSLSQRDNPIEQLTDLVDYEMYCTALEDVLAKKDGKTPTGWTQIDVVLMFKIIFLQRFYGIPQWRTKAC